MDTPRTWRSLCTADGSPTLIHVGLAQACHSRSGAWREARERYARPTRLRALARSGAEICVADVGTGVGWNLAAALAAREGTSARLRVWSFESDAAVLVAARELAAGYDGVGARWLRAAHEALAAASSAGRAALVQDGREVGELQLELGDARERLPAVLPREPRFDAVFLDAFSPAVDPPLWEAEFLQELAARLLPAGWLSTYTVSLNVRERLARAGLRVGRGPRVGTKAEGTLASREGEPPDLTPRVARKLARRLAAPQLGLQNHPPALFCSEE